MGPPQASAGVDGQVTLASTTKRGFLGFLPVEGKGQIALGVLSAGVAAKPMSKGGPEIGASAGFTGAKVQGDGLVGSKQVGLTGGAELDVLSAQAFAGMHNGTTDTSVDLSLATVHASAGIDVAGYNVGIEGAVGLKWGRGTQVGNHTALKLPFFSIGFTFGPASD
jgi:hypothetical protein